MIRCDMTLQSFKDYGIENKIIKIPCHPRLVYRGGLILLLSGKTQPLRIDFIHPDQYYSSIAPFGPLNGMLLQ